jgi:hypothetical protein
MSKTKAIPFLVNENMGFAFDKYPSSEVYKAELERLKNLRPDIFNYYTDRKSYGGDYDLYWATIGDINKPAIFIVSTLHAKNEWCGAHIMMHFIEKLLTPDDNQNEFNKNLLDSYCIIAIPMVNAWGYFASPDGKHYNHHQCLAEGIEEANWHDMTNYKWYFGVDLNRNFDCNWENYGRLPFLVKDYWNGADYGFANYFMMPYYDDSKTGNKIYDPQNKYPNHILEPDPDVYDYKGTAPFSEPETQLIRDLFHRYKVVGFMDWHIMNPWQKNNAGYISRNVNRKEMIAWINDGIKNVNKRHPGLHKKIPACNHIIIEDYDGNAPLSINWAQNKMGVKSFGWETGTDFPVEVWTDAYMEMFYRAIYWMQN